VGKHSKAVGKYAKNESSFYIPLFRNDGVQGLAHIHFFIKLICCFAEKQKEKQPEVARDGYSHPPEARMYFDESVRTLETAKKYETNTKRKKMNGPGVTYDSVYPRPGTAGVHSRHWRK